MSSSTIIQQIIAEYDRTSWTATAKSAKYVKVYALLRQATSAQHSTISLVKQAQCRNLMARVCLAKLSCPVSAALHSIEAAVGFIDCRLYSHAAQCLHDSISAIREEKPKYGSIASA